MTRLFRLFMHTQLRKMVEIMRNYMATSIRHINGKRCRILSLAGLSYMNLFIRCVSSYSNLWALIMNAETGFTNQVYELSPVFLYKVIKWRKERVKIWNGDYEFATERRKATRDLGMARRLILISTKR